MTRLVHAQSLRTEQGTWNLGNVQTFDPQSFGMEHHDRLTLDIGRDLESLHVSTDKDSPEEMSLWSLSKHIKMLQDSGANVEHLRTAWHLKLSYAFSCLVLSAVALILTRHRENLFLVISAGLGIIFTLYALHAVGGTLGESGALPPWLGAWLGNILVGGVAGFTLVLKIRGT